MQIQTQTPCTAVKRRENIITSVITYVLKSSIGLSHGFEVGMRYTNAVGTQKHGACYLMAECVRPCNLVLHKSCNVVLLSPRKNKELSDKRSKEVSFNLIINQSH